MSIRLVGVPRSHIDIMRVIDTLLAVGTTVFVYRMRNPGGLDRGCIQRRRRISVVRTPMKPSDILGREEVLLRSKMSSMDSTVPTCCSDKNVCCCPCMI